MNATTILLEPLPGDSAAELLDNLLGENDLPAEARERILDAADGNPLFVEEMVGMLIDDGLLRFDGTMWRAAEDLADLTVPPTIQLLLAARLDRLDAEERAVMERGAVEGKVFHAGAVTSLVPEPLRAQVRPRLLTLARKELIRPDRAEFAGDDAFRFRHLLIRDAAYQAMPKEQRADLHERFAAWLERAAGDRAEEYIEILGHHLEQAVRYRRELGSDDDTTRSLGNQAAAVLARAAGRSSIRGDLRTTTHQLERAVELSTGPRHEEVLADLAEAQLELSDYREALASAERLSGANDALIRIRAEIVRISVGTWTDPSFRHAEVRERFEELREESRALGSQELVDRCELAIALVVFFAGRIEAHRRIVLQLMPRLQTMKLSERRAIGFAFAASLFWGPQSAADAADTPDWIERIHEGSLLGRARAQTARVVLRSMADDQAGFDEAIEQLEGLQADIGDPSHRYLNAQPRLEALRRLGRIDDAVRWGTAAKQTYDRLGETGANSTLAAITASYAVLQGSLELGERLLADARAMAAADDFAAHVPIGWATALLASARGDHETALGAIDGALELIRPTDYLCLHAETERVHAKVLRAAGLTAEAQAASDAALEMFERKGDVASANRLREELAGPA